MSLTRHNKRTILIMAGGTGGHVYPALAVAKHLRENAFEVVWLGVREGLEATVVPQAGIDIRFIKVSGLRGKGLLGWLLAPLKILFALWRCVGVIRDVRPSAIMGMGGYVAGPGAVAAWLLRVPLLIHEQNAIAGLTNRIAVRLASVVMEAFPSTFDSSFGAIHTGNPVRFEICELVTPEERFANRQGPVRVLVLGGSQGALALNRELPKTLREISQMRLEVRHQAGAKTEQVAREAYADLPHVTVSPYIDDMAQAYAWADLVVCRAGAMTIAELACAGVASILVPFPFAVDDHQTKNAAYLANAGAAVIVAESDLANQLRGLLQDLTATRDKLLTMAKAARAVAMPAATQRVAGLCMETANV